MKNERYYVKTKYGLCPMNNKKKAFALAKKIISNASEMMQAEIIAPCATGYRTLAHISNQGFFRLCPVYVVSQTYHSEKNISEFNILSR